MQLPTYRVYQLADLHLYTSSAVRWNARNVTIKYTCVKLNTNVTKNQGCGVGGKISDSKSDFSKISDSDSLKLYSHGMRPVRFLSACVWLPDVTSFSDAAGMVCVGVEPVSILTHQTHCSDSFLLEVSQFYFGCKNKWKSWCRAINLCFNKSFKRNCTISTGNPNLGAWCKKWSNWTSGVVVGQKNATPALSVVRNPTPPKTSDSATLLKTWITLKQSEVALNALLKLCVIGNNLEVVFFNS